MKKSLLYLLGISLALIGLVNCSPKTTKTKATETTLTSPKPGSGTPSSVVSPADKAANSSSSSSSAAFTANPMVSSSAKKMNDMTMDEQLAFVGQADGARLQAGKQLFEAKCGKCHDLYSPASRGRESWVRVMKSMSSKAQLNDPEYAMVCAYLVKNARP